jgi:prepilin peptidase CpaA
MCWFFLIEKITAITLLIILCVFDIKTKKIPNKIVFAGIGVSIILFVVSGICHFNNSNYWERLLLFVGIFFFGMTNWIGLGDIKLLMALSLITHPIYLCATVAIAAIFMMLYAIIKNPINTFTKIQFSLLNVYYRRIPSISKDNAETIPFVPFLLVGYIVITVVEVILICS